MEKIKAIRLNCMACIYLRQSTPMQIEHNFESAILQNSRLESTEVIVWRKNQTKAFNPGDLPNLQEVEDLIKSSSESALEKLLISSFSTKVEINVRN